ncbi:META domain-containing protein [Roseobacter ponti]|uniref:META domain-containing protein n=1 Tax=Roseobacter ponti TaxID=1891787 RepID=A0A858SUH6_9RHOB|nr:META domain-containing protein [Roseobacter ponti]QJF51628.1 META domain-containing protein [Roseobacter ponti]
MKSADVLKFMVSTLFATAVTGAALASEWRFVSVDSVAAQGAALLRIGEDNSLSGATGCNRFNIQGTYEENELSLAESLASTRMACPDPAVDAQEKAILALLRDRVAVEYDAYTEQLTLSGNGHSAVLQPASGVADEGLPAVFGAQTVMVTGLSGLLNFRAEPTTSSQIVGRLRPRSLHANLGCERKDDRDWCRLSLENGVVGWAAAQYLSPLTVGRRAKSGSYDKIGRLNCTDKNGENAGRCEFGAAIEDAHAIVSVFASSGAPVVLHFRQGSFDPVSSFGPFAVERVSSHSLENGVRVITGGYQLDVPERALRP